MSITSIDEAIQVRAEKQAREKLGQLFENFKKQFAELVGEYPSSFVIETCDRKRNEIHVSADYFLRCFEEQVTNKAIEHEASKQVREFLQTLEALKAKHEELNAYLPQEE